MSYEEFRKRIDTARDILVGAVPSPAGQIDQITYALMYKFMNDIDDQSVALGGKRTYFTGDYEKYNWHALMSPQLGAHERLALYREAIQTMAKNPNLPELFREIYQNAFLPFNSPNVLNLFLKEMDKFSHEDSDDIGDAYEYLLSITGAQGDVGQFRTPRHIIKFIVEAVNPTKDDSVLDPAAGTAGFLIAAYNHVKSQHDGKDGTGNANDEKRLTADEMAKLYKNYHGFDIDPTMVRTARVNMYLHGFTTPDIQNHDTLTSEDHWDKKYDVILANPPFMTPKGGIQPHKKFSITANRAEVLFVDYIVSHINPVSGRAGIVVPEGIIFQSGKAYKELRKNLVENSLYAVVSLPSGVFNPYAGVKTSVLLLDKQLAKERDEVLFVKIENDGLSLSTQRRPIQENDLPEALEIINEFKKSGTIPENAKVSATPVLRSDILGNDNYDLAGERYQTVSYVNSVYPRTTLNALEEQGAISFMRGQGISKSDIAETGRFKCIRYGELYTMYQSPVINEVVSRTDYDGKVRSEIGDVYVPATTTADAMGIAIARSIHENDVVIGGDINIMRVDQSKLNPDFLSWLINGPLKSQLASYAKGANILHISNRDLRQLEVILPPLEIQKKIVAEIENKQRAINHAQEIIKSLERERAYFDPSPRAQKEGWPIVKITDVTQDIFAGGDAPKNAMSKEKTDEYAVPIYSNGLEEKALYGYTNTARVHDDAVTISARGTIGNPQVRRAPFMPIVRLVTAIPDTSKITVEYLAAALSSLTITSTGNSIQQLTVPTVKDFLIALPPLEVQHEIIDEFTEEQKIATAAKTLITLYNQKIRTTLAEVWGE